MEGRLLAALAWQLGPLQRHARQSRVEHEISEVAQCAVHWYVPRRVRGALVVVPGLHPLGPSDARLELFCRRLASCGLLVACPALSAPLRLCISPQSVDQLEAVIEAIWQHGKRPCGIAPGVFSISFGSYPALAVRTRPVRIGATVLFGGFYDFAKVIDYIVDNQGDPLNKPAACINAAPVIASREQLDPARLVEAWLRFCRETWGRPAAKQPAELQRVASQIAELTSWADPRERLWFLMGCNALPDDGRVASAARAAAASFAFLDEMRRGLGCGSSPIYVVHGANDDVIEVSQSKWLAEAIPATLRGGHFITGMYGHTSTSALGKLSHWPQELVTMVSVLKAMASAATQPESRE